MVRDRHLQGHAIRFALSSLPNFVSAVSFPALVMSWRKQYTGLAPGLESATLAQIAIPGWEFVQLCRPGMVFDTNDIVATRPGGLVRVLVWPMLDRSMRAG